MIDVLPKIVFEIGINHNGSVILATQIMDMCLEAVDKTKYPKHLIYFKFQKRNPDVSTPEHMKTVLRTSPVTGRTIPYLQYKHEIEFWEEDYMVFDWLFDECGGWFASVWDLESLRFIEQKFSYVPYIKIPSAHITNDELVLAATATRKRVIISTGMSELHEIQVAISSLIRSANGSTILSCTATYPCPDEEVNFFKLDYLKHVAEENAGIKHGFSSHSISPFPAIYSNFYGVDMIEVHVTKDRALPGSDHAASLEYNAVELLLRETLRISKLWGRNKFIYPSEAKKRKSLRG